MFLEFILNPELFRVVLSPSWSTLNAPVVVFTNCENRQRWPCRCAALPKKQSSLAGFDAQELT